jgi:outer membrane protein assembly factor BamB
VTVLSPELAARRSEGVRAVLDGRAHEAVRALHAVLEARPIDVGSYALITAAHARASAFWQNETERLLGAKARLLSLDPEKHEERAPLSIDGVDVSFTLGAPSVRPLGDVDAWFARHDAERAGAVDEDEAAFGVTVEGRPLLGAFHGADHATFLFGEEIVGVRAEEGDPISLFRVAPEGAPRTEYTVRAADAAGSALIVELQRAAGAPDGKPDDFLVALDAATGDVRWISEPGTASAESFVLAGHRAIAAVRAPRSTGELHVLDLANGRTIARTPLAFEPEQVLVVEGRLFVLGAADEAEIPISPALPPPPAFDRRSSARRADPRAAADRCAVERALVALDARDGSAAAKALAGLLADGIAAARALGAAADFVDRSAREPGSVVDLTERMPVQIAAGAPYAPGQKPKPAARVRLTKKKTVSLRAAPPPPPRRGPIIVSSTDDPAQPIGPPPPLEAAVSPPFEVPDAFGNEVLQRSAMHGDETTLVYGRFVAVLGGARTRGVFDLSSLAPPGRPGPIVIEAAAHGDQLLVAIEGEIGAEPAGDSDYIVSIDVETGAILWKSPSLVATTAFVLDGDTLFSAGGSEGAGWTLYALHADTGEIVARERLSKQPQQIGFLNDELTVVAADEYTTYAIAGRPKRARPPLTPVQFDF